MSWYTDYTFHPAYAGEQPPDCPLCRYPINTAPAKAHGGGGKLHPLHYTEECGRLLLKETTIAFALLGGAMMLNLDAGIALEIGAVAAAAIVGGLLSRNIFS